MIEIVNPQHPDKVADRIAGALVDLAYSLAVNPKVAIEVLIGHGTCHIINETSVKLPLEEVAKVVYRIAGPDVWVDYKEVPQDKYLAANQKEELRCGDNGIFRGVPVTNEQKQLKTLARELYHKWPSDGKYLLHDGRLTICQSNAKTKAVEKFAHKFCGNSVSSIKVNPLGDWTGGTNVDCGATNRKLGSDMLDSCTGGGLHGKDLSKADVSVNIYAWLKAQTYGRIINLSCSIGDTVVDNRPYSEIVKIAQEYIQKLGGFEKLAEWGYQLYKNVEI